MRFKNKYKHYDKCFFFLRSFPNKILTKFKKSKWRNFQQFFKKSNPINFLDRSVVGVNFKTWEKLQLLYKESLYIKTSIVLSHDQAFNLKFYKKNIKRKHKKGIDTILQNFIKPFFSLRLLLYLLRFAKSSYLSKQMLQYGKVYVNSKKSLFDKTLKKGDTILIKDMQSLIKVNTPLTFCYSFVEIDYYTNTFSILKDLDEFTFEDISLLLKENFDFRKFLYYIKKN